MTVINDASDTSDAVLIARTRDGDMAAYDELYRKHVDDAAKVARIVMSNDDEAQDLVSEAFVRVLRRLQDGGGPDESLAPYLRTVVRRLAIDHFRASSRSGSADPSTFDVMPSTDDPIAKATDRQMVRRAFEELPTRWQEVLWRTEIEGRSPAWLAERLGTSANAVAALAYRAREGLRKTYISMNIADVDSPECLPFASKIPSLTQGGLPDDEAAPVRAHIEACAPCRERRDEMFVLVSDLPAALWPALLLPVAGSGVVVGAGAAGAAGTGGLAALLSPSQWGQNVGRTMAVSGTVVVAAAIAAALMLVSSDTPESPAAAPPPPAEEPAEPVTENEPPAPEPEPEPPADEPEPAEPAADPAPVPDPVLAPGFSSQPQDVTTRAGEPVTLTATPSGRPVPELQWQARAGGWEDIPGADGTEIDLPAATPEADGSQYRVVATSESGRAVSDVATLTVHYAPSIVAGPGDADADFGADLVLSATAEANPAISTVRWQVQGGDGWSDLSGSSGLESSGAESTTTTLELSGVGFDDTARYRAVFENEVGSAATGASEVSVAATGTLRTEVSTLMGGWGDWNGWNDWEDWNSTVVRCAEPSGDRVVLSECSGSSWRLSGDGTLRTSGGACLDVRGGGFWALATTAPCTADASQQWTIDPDGGAAALANRAEDCLVPAGWSDQAVLAAGPCNAQWGQSFEFAAGG